MFAKAIFDKTGMHQTNINSGHRAFDRQVSVISHGNVIGSTQTSFHIRPFTETERNGFVNAPGYLRTFDLNSFRANDTPAHVRRYVEVVTKTEGVWLYHFFHYARRAHHPNWGRTYRRMELVSDCWIVTSDDMHRVLRVFSTHPTRWWLGIQIADACLPFIIDTPATEAQHDAT